MNKPNGILGVITLGLSLLLSSTIHAQGRTTPDRATAAREALIRWFECVECTDGELDALQRYASEVESALGATLNNGLSPAKRAEVELKLRRQFQANKWPADEEKRFVEVYASFADSRYRSRAIEALVRLRTRGAATILRQALSNPSLTPALRAEVRAALDSLGTPTVP